ncbi:MAG: glycosyltransferase family 4 protein [Bdellovibrionales bacterium]|nr:glycosyltransferase family 4 protein [Bdellovibrionales bacterium]
MRTPYPTNQPKRILLVMQGSESWIGGVNFIKNIIFALSSLPADLKSLCEIHVLLSKELGQEHYKDIVSLVNKVHFREDSLNHPVFEQKFLRKIFHRISEFNLSLDAFVRSNNFDFVFPMLAPPNRATRYRSAVWIPDFQHKHLPQYFTKNEIDFRDTLFARYAKLAFQILLISQDGFKDFANLYPDSVSKCTTLPFRISPRHEWYLGNPDEVYRRYNLPEKFLLICNQFWQHKNHLLVFKALALQKELGNIIPVVCTGHLGDYRKPDYSDEILSTIAQLGIAEQVYLLGLTPREDQIALVRRSAGLIQPSLFEGWNTSVEEARIMGKHILLSDLAVHREQSPPDALFFKPDSVKDLSEKMQSFYKDLLPGPDLTRESKARESGAELARQFGIDFLSLATGFTVSKPDASKCFANEKEGVLVTR